MGNQRRMTPRPLFSSRKSPNPPTENRLTSMSLMPIQTSRANQRSVNQLFNANSIRSEMCASDSYFQGGLPGEDCQRNSKSYSPSKQLSVMQNAGLAPRGYFFPNRFLLQINSLPFFMQ